jgi:transposase
MNENKSSTRELSRKYRQRRGKRLPKRLEVVHPHAAAIDVGSTEHYVSVRDDADPEPVQRFGCFTPELERMAQWLKQCRVTTVALESTGVYWIPVFRVLEAHGLEVVLVNPRHVKHVPGRKSDVADCQWLQQLHTFGLLRGAFVPPQEVAAMRTYARHRAGLVQRAAEEIQHMQKALTQMNLQLHTVLSDIAGLSGMKIIRAILAGERDPVALAQLAHPQVKSSRQAIAQALSGHYTEDHLFVLKQAVESFDFLHSKIQDCDEQLHRYVSRFESKATPEALAKTSERPNPKRRKNQPHFDLRTELHRLTGVDLTRIDSIDTLSAFAVVSEIGFDVSAFPTEGHFVSWIGSICPNNTITGGKVIRRGTKRVHNRVANALRIAAQSLWHSKSYLGAYFRRMRARHGPAKAITILAHKLARLIYRMLKYGQEYVDKGEQYLEKQHHERSVKSLIRHAKELGYTLVDPATGECLV